MRTTKQRHKARAKTEERRAARRASRTTSRVVFGGETWEVPRGFGREYLRIAKLDSALPIIDAAEGLIEVLGLVGYTASVATVTTWPLRKRVEANVYAANVHLRAGDNPVQRHPRLTWLPDAWQGPPVGDGLYASPGPTELPGTGDRDG